MRLRAILVVCALVGITSQNQLRAQFLDGQYVVGSGFSASFIHSDDIESSFRPGMNCSFGFKYDFSDRFGMLAYFDFSNMGARVIAYEYNDRYTFDPVQLKLYYSFIMVDYLASYKLMDPLSIQFGGCVGAKWISNREYDYSYCINESEDYSSNFPFASLVEEMFEDYGLVAGLSAGNEDVQFCLNYKYYLKNMFAGFNTPFAAHNGVLELKVLILTDFDY